MSGSVVIKKKTVVLDSLANTHLGGEMVCLRVRNSGTGNRVGKRFGQIVQAHPEEQIMYSKHFMNRDSWPATPIAIHVFDLFRPHPTKVASQSGSFWCH
jgi:hypothetical protein